MAKRKKTAKIGAHKAEVLADAPYATPEFETISVAKRPPKPVKPRKKRKAKALKNKEFSAENLFMTDG